jgi:hypothetical protein
MSVCHHQLLAPLPGHQQCAHRGALFAVGSKFTHTCGQPNSVFKSCGGLGYHVALRDIAQGELLTTTYLEGGPMLMATPYR